MLAKLLQNYIAVLEPSTPLIRIDGWPKVIADNNTWKELLEMEENWDKNIPSVLMFYLVEMTYWNADLWNTLFKPISDHPLTLSHRIIIFTGCPNPTRIDALPVAPVTNMHIKPSQMVSLAPIDHHDGLGAAGLYVTRSELDEIAKLKKYSFDPACLNFIFRITSGHVGAIQGVNNVITSDEVSLPAFHATANKYLMIVSHFFLVVQENPRISKTVHHFRFFPTFHSLSSVRRTWCSLRR